LQTKPHGEIWTLAILPPNARYFLTVVLKARNDYDDDDDDYFSDDDNDEH